jgi:NADP-dependent 3-hydroxy acid dehydrogenase YdfG
MIKELTGNNENVSADKLDVSDRAAIAQSAREVQEKFGMVDILINNAGIV